MGSRLKNSVSVRGRRAGALNRTLLEETDIQPYRTPSLGQHYMLMFFPSYQGIFSMSLVTQDSDDKSSIRC